MGDADHGVPRTASALRAGLPSRRIVAPSPRSVAVGGRTIVKTNDSATVDRFVWGIVNRKERQLMGRAGFERQDRDDVRHELLAHLLGRLKSFDPAKGHRNGFVTALVERHVATMLRDKMAKKRDRRREVSLHMNVDAEDGVPTELARTVGQREYDARRGVRPRGDLERAELANDVDAVLSSLPKNLRDLANGLKSRSQAEVARDLGVPPTTVTGWMRTIRARFEDAGLREYLEF